MRDSLSKEERCLHAEGLRKEVLSGIIDLTKADFSSIGFFSDMVLGYLNKHSESGGNLDSQQDD